MAASTPDIPDGGWLAHRDAETDERPALVGAGESLTFAELDAAVRARSAEILKARVLPGDVVVLDLPAGLEFAITLHALHRVGAAPLPLNPRLPGPERAAAVAEADPALTVDEAGNLEPRTSESEAADARRQSFTTGDGAVFARILTSGTSGSAKQIELTQGNFVASAAGTADALGPGASAHWLCCMPLFHVGGLSIVTRAAIFRTTAEIHPRFDVDRVAAALEERRITGISLVATQLKRLLDVGADLSGPQAIVVGGGPLHRDLLEEALGRGAAVLQTYGLTEACSQVTILRPGEALDHLGSSGRPISGAEIRIVDEEIHVKGPTVARDSLAADGWLHTGDAGRIDDAGYLYVTDRLGDMIVTGGENVLPTEVEEALLTHPGVEDAAVVGREDREWGEAVTAVIVLTEGANADAEGLRAHAAERLAPHQVPKRYEFTDVLPRTASGKLRRKELR